MKRSLGVCLVAVLAASCVQPPPPRDARRVRPVWPRVEGCVVTKNGRRIEADVFQSPEGTILLDLGGMAYLVQPFWGQVRSLTTDYYRVGASSVALESAWPVSYTLTKYEPIGVDPKLTSDGDLVSFIGLDHQKIVIRGDISKRFVSKDPY